MTADAHTPTYDEVVPLLVDSRVKGPSIEYVFRCPVTGAEFTGVATPVQEVARRSGGSGSVPDLARMDVEDRVENWLPGFQSGVDTVKEVFNWRRRKHSHTAPSAEDAAAAADQASELLLAAFATVADRFRWDGTRWISSEA